MDFPAEILEIIASHLPSKDQHQGLFVCKDWYAPFCRSLYRHIEFKHRPQFKIWLDSSSQYRHLVRSIQFGRHCANSNDPQEQQQSKVDCVTGAMPLYSMEVGVTSRELKAVLEQLPLLESMQFDSRLWQYLNTRQLEKAAATSNRLLTLPALDHPRQLSFIQSKRDMFQLHKKGLFLDIFRSTPNLMELTVDADGLSDSKHVMSFSMQDVEALHQSLPLLKRLALVDAVRLMEPSSSMDHDDATTSSSSEHQIITVPSTRLAKLHLHVQIEKYGIHQWLAYLSYKYPLLTDLALHLSSPYQTPRQPQLQSQQLALEQSEKSALATLTSKLPLLEKLAIDSSMSKLYLGDTTIHSLSNNNKHLNRLQVGLWGDSVESTHSALQCVTSNPMTINSISHLCIPLWSSEKSMDVSLLSKLHQLTHLELIDKAGGGPQQQKQHTATTTASRLFSEQKSQPAGYPIDIILTSCPYLVDLKLHSGQITSHTYQQQLHPHIHLKSLRMDRVEIYETSDVFHYLSHSCPNLAHVFLRKCISDSFDLALSNLHLARVVLSELRQYPDRQLDHLTLLQQQQPTTDIRLYKSLVHPHTLRPYIRRLKKMQHAHIYLECQSVDQLIFNGCKI
ncbi:hypothetical protein MBANPS3_007411 [Mucor bainieri]